MEKRKINRIINLCFLVYLCLAITYNMIGICNSTASGIGEFKLALEGNMTNFSQVLTAFLMLFSISFIMTFLNNMIIILLFIGIKIGMKSIKKEKLNDSDFGKYKGYYREIIKEYSPAVLSFIDDFEIIKDKDIVASLLGLKLKKHIDDTETEIQVMDNDDSKLDQNEKYLLENRGKYELSIFKNLVIKDALEHGLIEIKHGIKKKILQKIIFLAIGFVLIQVMFFMLMSIQVIGGWHIEDNPILLLMIITAGIPIIFFIIGYPIFSIIHLISYKIKSAQMPYIRTKKGNEINELLEGLKNYLKDFTMLDKRSKDELILWEDYLIYSVIFSQNKIVVQEFQEKTWKSKNV